MVINILSVALRTVIIYFILVLSMRISGKRQLGELQLSELVTAFLVSEVASAPITNTDIPILHAIISVTILIFLEISVSYVTTKSVSAKKLFEPAPTLLIYDGKLNIEELGKQRLTADELISSLRLKDISDICAVKYCFLEHNGEISAFTGDTALTLPIIIDGQILGGNLKVLGKNENWINKQIKSQKQRLSDIFIAVTDGNAVTIYAKNQKSNK